jgi:ferredoxin-type protein NapG
MKRIKVDRRDFIKGSGFIASSAVGAGLMVAENLELEAAELPQVNRTTALAQCPYCDTWRMAKPARLMDRRGFLRRGGRSAAETAVGGIDAYVCHRASRWIRPPHALDELSFLGACTRCGDCVEACPHDVVFTLSPRLGIQVAGTPALDIVNRGCHLCDDFPCVTVCEPGALTLPDTEERIAPLLARMSINEDTCLPFLGPECGGCEGSCPVTGALTWSGARPSIEPQRCTGCALCRAACILDESAIGVASIHAVSAVHSSST